MPRQAGLRSERHGSEPSGPVAADLHPVPGVRIGVAGQASARPSKDLTVDADRSPAPPCPRYSRGTASKWPPVQVCREHLASAVPSVRS